MHGENAKKAARAIRKKLIQALQFTVVEPTRVTATYMCATTQKCLSFRTFLAPSIKRKAAFLGADRACNLETCRTSSDQPVLPVKPPADPQNAVKPDELVVGRSE